MKYKGLTKTQLITELEVSETQRKQAEDLFKNLFDSSPAGIYIVQDGEFQLVNPQFQVLTGYSEHELLGTDSLRLVLPEDRKMVKKNTVKILKGERSSPYEYRIVNKAGKTMWVMETVTPIQYQGRLASLGSIVDITERKKAEEALRESEEKYRDLVEREKDIIYTLDAEGNITSANSAIKNWGFELEELVGKHFIELIPKEWQEKTVKDFNNLLMTGEITAETVLLDKKGEPHFVEYSSTVIKKEGKVVGTRGIIRDMTERKKAEQALWESEKRLRDIFEAAENVSFIITDLAGTEAHILEFSPGAERIFGYSREEVIGKPVAILHLPEDVARFPEVIESMRQRKAGFTGESVLVRKSGERFPALFTTYPVFDAQGDMVATLGVSIDITECKQAEEALRESEKRFAAFMKHLPGVGFMKDKKGRYLYVNEPFKENYEKAYGVRLEDWQGKTDDDLLPLDIAATFKANDQLVLSTGKPLETIEITQLKDGLHYWLSCKFPIKDESGNPIIVAGVAIDITKQKRVEEELRRRRDRLEELVRARTAVLQMTNEQLRQEIIERKRAEDNIRLYAEIVKNVQIGLLVWQMEDINELGTARLVAVNPAATQLTGTAIEDILGKTAAESFPAMLETEVPKICAELISSGGTKDLEEVRYSDQRVPAGIFSVKAFPLPNNCVGIAFENITERKRIEKKIKESENKFKSLFNRVFDAIIMMDEKGQITDVNESTCRLLGYTKEELLKFSVGDINPEEETEKAKAAVRRVLRNGIDYMGETALTTKEGKILRVEAGAVTVELAGKTYIMGSFRDITERKWAEEALRQSEQRYRSLVETAMDVIFTISSDGIITSLNPAFEKITGWSRAAWLGKSFTSIVHPDDLAYATGLFKRVLQGETLPIYQVRIMSKSGEYLIGEFTSTPQFQEGKVVGVLGIARDITERQRAE